MRTTIRWLSGVIILLLSLLLGPALVALSGEVDLSANWSTADRQSAGLAPAADAHPEAIFQIYAARAFSWRGAFAVHTWIATKAEDSAAYEVHEVTTWRGLRSGRSEPDRAWYGNPPSLLLDLRGDAAEAVLAKLPNSLERYPYADDYQAWPGPNSNTFTAWVIRDIPELQLALPTTAVGKDHLGNGLWARATSDSGVQLSFLGVLGITIAAQEGLELNILGLVVGIDPMGLAVHIPGIGRLGQD